MSQGRRPDRLSRRQFLGLSAFSSSSGLRNRAWSRLNSGFGGHAFAVAIRVVVGKCVGYSMEQPARTQRTDLPKDVVHPLVPASAVALAENLTQVLDGRRTGGLFADVGRRHGGPRAGCLQPFGRLHADTGIGVCQWRNQPFDLVIVSLGEERVEKPGAQ